MEGTQARMSVSCTHTLKVRQIRLEVCVCQIRCPTIGHRSLGGRCNHALIQCMCSVPSRGQSGRRLLSSRSLRRFVCGCCREVGRVSLESDDTF